MASWQIETEGSTHDTNQAITELEKGRNRDVVSQTNTGGFFGGDADANGDVIGTAGGERRTGFLGLGGTTGYNIVGINGNEIANMTASIEEYVTAVQETLKTAIDTTQADLGVGFRGTDAEANVKKYLDNVKEYIKNLASSLNTFQDKLNDVGNAWRKAQKDFGDNIIKNDSFNAGNEYKTNVRYEGSSGGSAPVA